MSTTVQDNFKKTGSENGFSIAATVFCSLLISFVLKAVWKHAYKWPVVAIPCVKGDN